MNTSLGVEKQSTTIRELPQHAPLTVQLADILREHISCGEWPDTLPSERQLAERFQISRPTLRAALGILERERIVERRPRRRTRILRKPAAASSARTARVIMLSVKALDAGDSPMPFLVSHLQNHLQQINCRLEIRHDRRLESMDPDQLLPQWLSTTRADVWILFSLPGQIQRWMQQQQVPAVIAGTRHEDIRLPAVDVDYRAACRHAAGVFLGRGHKRIALLAPADMRAGDCAAVAGFEEAVRLNKTGAAGVILRYQGGREELIHELEGILRKPDRPTALLVNKPLDVISVLTWLSMRGMAVPRHYSLISRDDREFVASIFPTIARYHVDWPQFANRLSRQVLRVVKRRELHGRQIMLPPHFVAGESVGVPSECG